MADNSKKRKPTPSIGPPPKRPRFPPKPHQRRNIPSTPTTTAYPNGEINVRNFLKSHDHEIKSLESAMRIAKQGLNRRAFQDVPRDLRRRTASHNPQRVPKRLRGQAKKEANEDNTPISRGMSGSGVGKGKKKWLRREGIERSRQAWERRARRREGKGKGKGNRRDKGKDGDIGMASVEDSELAKETTEEPKKVKTKRPKFPALASPALPPSRFRRRQINKTWLPTHVWHSKRAFMSPPKEPLWRFAIPLAPNVKAYRLTHRAAALRGAVAWDMSYMATIGLEGVEASIIGMLHGLRFADEDAEDPWQDRGRGKKWRDGTRAWEGWIYEREGKPPKSIAHITVVWCVSEAARTKRKALIRVHPSGFLHLWEEVVRISKVQKPVVTVEDLRFEIGSIEIMGPAAAETLCSILCPSNASDSAPDTPQKLWQTFAPVMSPAVLPSGALFAFRFSDPRLRDPPEAMRLLQNAQTQAALVDTLTNWPIDTTQEPPAIFNRDSRLAAARSLPSQQSINRRQSVCTTGGYPEPCSTDPQIPMLTYVSRKSKSWVILLPWKCLPPVWRGIMHYPVSTGGNPRFGGLNERRQVDFERANPSFPFDHPGTNAGWSWELQERAAREHDWRKRPRGKRIEWSTIDLGNGRKGEVGDPWACDWERLLPAARKEACKDGKVVDETARTPFRQLSTQAAVELVAARSPVADHLSPPHLFTVKISMCQRGTPTNCARIYRLPTNNPGLRSRWLSCSIQSKGTAKKAPLPRGIDVPKHVRNQRLAESLLERPPVKEGVTKAGEDDYPVVPDEIDLIGFVTTGNYNLAEGKPTAVANLAVHKVFEGKGEGVRNVCVVREAGRTVGRLATWEVV